MNVGCYNDLSARQALRSTAWHGDSRTRIIAIISGLFLDIRDPARVVRNWGGIESRGQFGPFGAQRQYLRLQYSLGLKQEGRKPSLSRRPEGLVGFQ